MGRDSCRRYLYLVLTVVIAGGWSCQCGVALKSTNRWTVPPMWGRPMKDVQEGNPTTHDMASPVLAGGGGR
ncbi:hypothetical protein LINPERHAP2_LOCUS27501 [Linum perenne]